MLKNLRQKFCSAVSSALHDQTTWLAAAALLTFAVMERGARTLANIPAVRLHSPSLLASAVGERPWVFVTLGACIVAFLVLARGRVLLRWSDLEHGPRLQLVAGLLMSILTWRYVAGAWNFYFSEWYLTDRILTVLLMTAALYRPVFLPLWVVAIRLLQQPFRATPFVVSGLQIDELAIQVVAVLGAMTLVKIAAKPKGTAFALPVIAAAIAANFFLPGRIKLMEDWLWSDNLSNLPLVAFSQGWLGSGDGSFASAQSQVIDPIERPLLLMTLLFELGSVVAVFRRKLLVAWLFAAIGFHAAVLATYGFVFLEFVAVEALVIFLVAGPKGLAWAQPAFAAGPSLVAGGAVVLGTWFFHPPVLVWFDGHIAYSYDIQAEDEDGNLWLLESEHFAPYEDVFAFDALGLGPSRPLVGPYGAVGIGENDKIAAITSFQQVTEAEVGRDESGQEERAEILVRFLNGTRRDAGIAHNLPRPPQHFLTSAPGSDYSFDVPLMTLRVQRVTSLWGDDRTVAVRREPILTIQRDGEGWTTLWTG